MLPGELAKHAVSSRHQGRDQVHVVGLSASRLEHVLSSLNPLVFPNTTRLTSAARARARARPCTRAVARRATRGRDARRDWSAPGLRPPDARGGRCCRVPLSRGRNVHAPRTPHPDRRRSSPLASPAPPRRRAAPLVSAHVAEPRRRRPRAAASAAKRTVRDAKTLAAEALSRRRGVSPSWLTARCSMSSAPAAPPPPLRRRRARARARGRAQRLVAREPAERACDVRGIRAERVARGDARARGEQARARARARVVAAARARGERRAQRGVEAVDVRVVVEQHLAHAAAPPGRTCTRRAFDASAASACCRRTRARARATLVVTSASAKRARARAIRARARRARRPPPPP